jgi:hypothetical protein
MFSIHYSNWIAFAALLSLVQSDTDSICYSYGVDYVDEASYFINSKSNDPFSCVSTFRGCNNDVADVLFVRPDGEEYFCTDVNTYPQDQRMLSVCPVRKDQMTSGHWMLLIIGNNGDGYPFAWQRGTYCLFHRKHRSILTNLDLYLTVGPQATITKTPTVTFTQSTTPTQTQTVVSIFVSTAGPQYTVTIPSATAKRTKTVIPPRITVSATSTVTKTRFTSTIDYVVTTQTVTASCNVPGRPTRADKPLTWSPSLIQPQALETPMAETLAQHMASRADREVDYEWARSRVEAAKQRRDAKARGRKGLQRRAADKPTVTVTIKSNLQTTTVTKTAPAVVTTQTTLSSSTTTSTLPPATVYNGQYTYTITMPTPTTTLVELATTTSTRTKKVGATFTNTITVTPAALAASCKREGGRF